jgi:conjugal transfer mating pair stabilization protein TraN
MMRIWPVYLFILSLSVVAEDTVLHPAGADYGVGQAFAESQNNSVINKLGQSVDPATDIPGYQGSDVSQAKYYDHGSDLKGMATQQAINDPTANYLEEARTDRPQVNLSPDDPLFNALYKARNQDTATSLDQEYEDCWGVSTSQSSENRTNDHTCHVTGNLSKETFTCRKDLSVQCTQKNQQLNFNCYQTEMMSCPLQEVRYMYYGQCTYHRSYQFCHFDGKYFGWWFRPSKYGGPHCVEACKELRVTQYKICRDEPDVYQCDHGQNINQCTEDSRECITPGFEKYINGQPVNKSCWKWKLNCHKNSVACSQSESYRWSCPAGKSHIGATQVSRVCTQGEATRTINGFQITKPCWQWEYVFSDDSKPVYTPSQECKELDSAGCEVKSSKCIISKDPDPSVQGDEFCKDRLLEYSCPYNQVKEDMSLCGQQLICADGECGAAATESQEFMQAATALELSQQLSSQLAEKPLSVFNGSAKRCKQNRFLAISDCCNQNGWGVDIGLKRCDQDSKILGLARQAKRSTYVGSHKSGGLFDRRRYETHCVWPSQLARLVVEQGKAQLGQGFGHSQTPDCGGLTVDDLNSINFDAMDLSPAYAEVLSGQSGNGLNATQAADQIKAKLTTRYPDMESE